MRTSEYTRVLRCHAKVGSQVGCGNESVPDLVGAYCNLTAEGGNGECDRDARTIEDPGWDAVVEDGLDFRKERNGYIVFQYEIMLLVIYRVLL